MTVSPRLLPETKITEPYSPRARAKARAKPVSSDGAKGGSSTRRNVCQRVGRARHVVPHRGPELAPAQRRRLDITSRQRDQHQAAEHEDRVAKAQREARQDAAVDGTHATASAGSVHRRGPPGSSSASTW